MGCYGIGVSRLMAACVESLSTDKELRWPKSIAPFSVCVICPKVGSHEAAAMEEVYNLYDNLNSGKCESDVQGHFCQGISFNNYAIHVQWLRKRKFRGLS